MRRISAVTRKGQVTIPIEIRRAFDIDEGDTVAFVVEDNQITLVPQKGDVFTRTAGIFKSNLPPLSAEDLRVAAEIAMAEDADKSKWQ